MENFEPILTINYYRTNFFGYSQYSEDSVYHPERKHVLKAFRDFKKDLLVSIDYHAENMHYHVEHDSYTDIQNGIAKLYMHIYTDNPENNVDFREQAISVDKAKELFLNAVKDTVKDGKNENESEEVA